MPRAAPPRAALAPFAQAYACAAAPQKFLPLYELKESLYLEPLPDGASYVIMPATFGAGQRGPFSLGVSSDVQCEFELLGDKAAK